MRTQFILLSILITIIPLSACAPPWHGEECNFHVVSVYFWEEDFNRKVRMDSLGYTEILNLERDEIIDQSSWADVPELDFRRLDPDFDMILPVDPEAVQSTFVMKHPSGNDTLIIRYSSRLGNDRSGGCGYSFLLEDPTYSFRASPFQRLDKFNHPRILGELEVIR